MPRRKATPTNNANNNNVGEEVPNKRRRLVPFELPLPQKPHVVGRALVCGNGEFGQLGLGDDANKLERKFPAVLEGIENVVDVCAGGMHNLVLTKEGIVYSFGCNDEGALGRPTAEEGSEFEPKAISLPGEVLKMSAGDSHSACLLEDGRVFAWGSFRDSHGNMGLTLEGNKRLPIHLLPGIICTDIASGSDHLVMLSSQGRVFTIGCGEQGQLGRVSLRSASGDGRRGMAELLSPAQVDIRRGKPIKEIWATNYCTFLRESQTDKIWVFGLNNYKQLAFKKNVDLIGRPMPSDLQDVKQIAGGQHHTLILKTDGSCYVIGRADYGRLGLGIVNSDIKELKKIDFLEGKNIVSVSCGESTSFAVSAEGKVYSWGMGTNLQLGTGDDADVIEPVQIVSKQTQNKQIVRVSSGGQHTIFLVLGEEETPEKLTLTKKGAAAVAAKEKEAKKTAVNKEPPKQTNQEMEIDDTAALALEPPIAAKEDDKVELLPQDENDEPESVESTTVNGKSKVQPKKNGKRVYKRK